MKNYLDIIKKSSLFKNINIDNLEELFTNLKASIIDVSKNQTILNEGDKFQYIGLVIEGSLQIIKDDSEGKRTIIDSLRPPEIFGEVISYAKIPSPITLIAYENSKILQFNINDLLDNPDLFSKQIIDNFILLLISKNLHLQKRIEIISAKNTKTKIIKYLNSFDLEKGAKIIIPFNREELADYLCVERTSLSHELSKMKKEGIIDYNKNIFTLINAK
jgi:CRP-like cAMP-binding protein